MRKRKLVTTVLLATTLLFGCGTTSESGDASVDKTTVVETTTETVTEETTTEEPTTEAPTEEDTTEEVVQNEYLVGYNTTSNKNVGGIDRVLYGYDYRVANPDNGATTGIFAITNMKQGATVTWEVKVKKSGTYYVWLNYASDENREVDLYVNEVQQLTFDCVSTGDMNTYDLGIHTEVKLKKGTNTIMLTNNKADAPNIASIYFSYVEDESTEMNGAFDGIDNFKIREIEGRDRLLYVYDSSQAEISDGAFSAIYISDLNAGESAAWTINVEEAGKYYMWLQYATAETRSINLIYDSVIYATIECEPTGGWHTYDGVVIEIELYQGENKLVFTNPDEAAPNLSFIGFCSKQQTAEELAKMETEEIKQ